LAIGLSTVIGGWFLYSTMKSRIVEPLRARDGQILALMSQIQTKESELAAAQRGAIELSGWRKASLPADESVAQTLYLDYIRKLLSDAGIDRPTLRPGRSIDRADVFSRLPVTVDARADLDKLTVFLRSFENAPLLHQIRRLRIQPVIKESKIESYDLSMSLEAVAMPDSFSKDSLPTLQDVGDILAQRPQRSDVEFKVFVEKNPFQPTAVTSASAEKKKDEKGGGSVDERGEYYLRAILFVEGQGVVWFAKQGGDAKKVIREGEVLEVGGFRGTALRIDSDSVRLQVNDGIGDVSLGKNLSSWTKKETAAPKEKEPVPTGSALEPSPPAESKGTTAGSDATAPGPEVASPPAATGPESATPPAHSTESAKPPS
jgi:hypothetical protein